MSTKRKNEQNGWNILWFQRLNRKRGARARNRFRAFLSICYVTYKKEKQPREVVALLLEASVATLCTFSSLTGRSADDRQLCISRNRLSLTIEHTLLFFRAVTADHQISLMKNSLFSLQVNHVFLPSFLGF